MFYYGVVEDRLDPLQVGRVRVRVFDVHTHQKDHIATPDLPWSMVLMPTTVPGLGGFGQSHSLLEGTHVVGIFTDQEKQQFVVLGVNQGIASAGSLVTEEVNGNSKRIIVTQSNQHEIGFSDPRRRFLDSYDGKPDGKNPKHFPQRTFGLEKTLEYYPATPLSISPVYDRTNNEEEINFSDYVQEEPQVSKDTPYYPKEKTFYFDDADGKRQKQSVSDISKFSGVGQENLLHFYYLRGLRRDLSDHLEDFAERPTYAPRYPFNKATYTESGHLFELDDTPKKERVSLQHRSGTYFEYHADGDADTRVVKDNYTAICGNDTLYVGGKVKIKVLGDATLDVGGDLKADVAGKTTIDGTDDITVTAPVISMNGTTIKLNS